MFSKNKLIKVVSAFFYLFIFSAAKIFSFSLNDFADFLDLEFSFKSDVSMSSNILYEKVFENGTKASELRWMGFSPVISVGLETLINSSYYLGFSISSSIPTQIGNVTDKDFFINEKNNISKYSEHNVIIGLITQNTTESSSYTASTLYFNPMVTLGFKFIF